MEQRQILIQSRFCFGTHLIGKSNTESKITLLFYTRLTRVSAKLYEKNPRIILFKATIIYEIKYSSKKEMFLKIRKEIYLFFYKYLKFQKQISFALNKIQNKDFIILKKFSKNRQNFIKFFQEGL